jgi:hypothetical protein
MIQLKTPNRNMSARDPETGAAESVDAIVQVRTSSRSLGRVEVGEATDGLLAFLVREEDFPEAEVPRLRGESVNVLQGCSPPIGARARRTGLICGYVQSGKTASIETVSALGRDNGYRLIVLLAGVTKNLVGQSLIRIAHLRRGAGGHDWVIQENPRARNRPELDRLIREWRTEAAGGPRARTLFIAVMKQANHLTHLANLLKSVDLRGYPALIFDDEADQASLNTRPLDPRPSPVYSKILELRNALPHHTLLQYTATPQAPLLISRIDALSADFAEVIEPGTTYTGGQVFFRQRKDSLIKVIPREELIDEENLPESPPPSLEEALALFFVGVAAEYARRRPTGNRSMLIHPHHTTPVQARFLDWVEGLQRDWCDVIASPTEPDRPALLEKFQQAHAELSRTQPDVPTFEEIAGAPLIEALHRANPRLVNSKDGREVVWENAYPYILVGGEKLARGYTVKGLTVTYMPRGPGVMNADTIQQRARFFGYHSEYLGLCRVYLHPDVVDAYTAYLDHEEDVREKIRAHRGQPLQRLKRAFVLDADLRPTRHNVLARLYERPLRSEWFEQRWPHATQKAITDNRTLVGQLIKKVELQPHERYSDHRFADVLLRDLLENFLLEFACPDDRDETSLYAILGAVSTVARQRRESTCRIYFMSHGQLRGRQQDESDHDIDLMQGRSSAGADRYPGDRAIYDPDRPTLQIHILRIGTGRGGGGKLVADRVPALAVRLPDHLRRALLNVIVQAHH